MHRATTQSTRWLVVFFSCALIALSGCGEDNSTSGGTNTADTHQNHTEPDSNTSTTEPDSATSTTEPDSATSTTEPDSQSTTEPDADTSDASDAPDLGPERASLVHNFGNVTLAPFEESLPCISWTLNNEQALYVERIRMANDGGFHHANWYIVPDTEFPGPDGFWDCDSRGFSDLNAMLSGSSVLYAQSTQALFEDQGLGEGVVVKIPPRRKLIAGGHMLNLSSREMTTSMRMGLEAIHPTLVKDVVVPFRFSYDALRIHPQAETRLTGDCDIGASMFSDGNMRLKLYWLLPHYHNLGNYFSVEVKGGAMDGQKIFELTGFNAEPNGKTFNPPLDLTDAQGIKFTCGFNNPTSSFVGWGIGDQEMCMMLGFTSGKYMFDATVRERVSEGLDAENINRYGGPCGVLPIPTRLRAESFSMPTEEELTTPLNPPESDGTDLNEVFNTCQDTPENALPEAASTLTNIKQRMLTPSCTFSACHNGARPAAGLDLTADGLHARLMAHQPISGTDLPFITPGQPDASWFYEILSKCEPHTASGDPYPHMPFNSPVLLDPSLIVMVRDWIAAGALDD